MYEYTAHSCSNEYPLVVPFGRMKCLCQGLLGWRFAEATNARNRTRISRRHSNNVVNFPRLKNYSHRSKCLKMVRPYDGA